MSTESLLAFLYLVYFFGCNRHVKYHGGAYGIPIHRLSVKIFPCIKIPSFRICITNMRICLAEKYTTFSLHIYTNNLCIREYCS